MKYYRMKLGIMKDEQGNRSKPTIETRYTDEEGKEQVAVKEIEYIMRDEDKALIPCNEANADYLAYLADKDKVVEDFDYAKEEARQASASKEKPLTLEERIEALEERIKAREE